MANGGRSYGCGRRPYLLGLLPRPHRHDTTRRRVVASWHVSGSQQVGVTLSTGIHPRRSCHAVGRAEHPTATTIEHIDLDLCRRHILVPQQFLRRSIFLTGLELMRCKGLPQRSAPSGFHDATGAHDPFHRPLCRRLVHMVASPHPGSRISAGRKCGQDEPPTQFDPAFGVCCSSAWGRHPGDRLSGGSTIETRCRLTAESAPVRPAMPAALAAGPSLALTLDRHVRRRASCRGLSGTVSTESLSASGMPSHSSRYLHDPLPAL